MQLFTYNGIQRKKSQIILFMSDISLLKSICQTFHLPFYAYFAFFHRCRYDDIRDHVSIRFSAYSTFVCWKYIYLKSRKCTSLWRWLYTSLQQQKPARIWIKEQNENSTIKINDGNYAIERKSIDMKQKHGIHRIKNMMNANNSVGL